MERTCVWMDLVREELVGGGVESDAGDDDDAGWDGDGAFHPTFLAPHPWTGAFPSVTLEYDGCSLEGPATASVRGVVGPVPEGSSPGRCAEDDHAPC